MKQIYTQLHLHSSYSLIDSTINIDRLIKLAKKNKLKSLAITDRLNMFAAIKFYQKCIDNNIKPIIGCEIPLKNSISNKPERTIIALCQNYIGYKNLIKLLSEIHIEKKINENPNVTKSQLEKYNEGLIILTGGRKGILGENLLSDDYHDKYLIMKSLKDIFPDRLYLQIDRINADNEEIYNYKIINLAEDLNLPLVATNNVLFLEKQDFDAHEVRVCINKKIKIDDRINQTEFTNDQYFKTEKEMISTFEDLPDAIQNISERIKRCNIHISSDTYHLPKFRGAFYRFKED